MDMVLPLMTHVATLAAVGGKGANLAKLAGAGLPVPDGFMVTVAAYQAFVAANRLGRVVSAALNGLDATNPTALESASTRIRTAFTVGEMAPALRVALAEEYRRIGEPPVAVRSSATAEDLPDMSFAGQQDTYLNVQGLDALCDAVVACWGSLWTARAIGYRERNQVDQTDVALAVVVQRMVDAAAAGVLFTANPLIGRRTETAIDATMGLGEALVSGQVEPDHYVVDEPTRTIVHKTLGAKETVIVGRAGGGTVTERQANRSRQAIPDVVILELAALGAQVEALYSFPQDIEWAWDGSKVYLLQARPITSLYPLPAGMPESPLQVMFALAAVQGVFEPFTPLGQDSLTLILCGARRVYGLNSDFGRQTTFLSAAERIYINVTPLLRSRIGRKIVPRFIRVIDPGVAQAFGEIVDDPRMAPSGPPIRLEALRRILGFALPSAARIVRIWRDPSAARQRFTEDMDDALARAATKTAVTGDLWVDYGHQIDLILAGSKLFPELVIPEGVTAVVAGMAPFFGVLQRFAEQAAAAQHRPVLAQLPLTIARSLPYNVTTEMDLALWQAAQVIRSDATTAQAFAAAPAAELAVDYLAGRLPPVAQMAVAIFLHQYGMRGPGEIDLGRPRWREQPEPIMQVLQSYLAIDDPANAPDAVFAGGVTQAEAAAQELLAAVRATPGGQVKTRLVRWAISRYRALGGLREAPKFFAIRYMGIVRQGLLQSGQRLVELGMLQAEDDLFYMTIPELQEIGAQRGVTSELRVRVADRRAVHARELRRKQLPRVLLSDGTAYYEGVRADGDVQGSDRLVGDPVSPGVVEGTVHVVFSPNGTQLAPGEILVCPGTDPAWTPLFLAAGGLVMEVGGMMTHGSVVAREYGIPAVVGVHEATRRLQSGQRVRVDGMKGVVTLLDSRPGSSPAASAEAAAR
ncbi:MAG: PEP/pyruvate-binding domain-containing protein [Caldilineaceae bacterium]